MSKNREYFGNNKINIITYNNSTGLYDLTLNDNSIINTVRIFNTTDLISNNSNNGFFYISPDNKYIYLDGISPILDIQYLNFCLNNGSITNDELLEIQLTTITSKKKIQNESYDAIQLRLSSSNPEIISYLKKNVCINFAYEQNLEKRNTQLKLLKNNPIYVSYLDYECKIIYDISPLSMFGINNVDK